MFDELLVGELDQCRGHREGAADLGVGAAGALEADVVFKLRPRVLEDCTDLDFEALARIVTAIRGRVLGRDFQREMPACVANATILTHLAVLSSSS